jgi:hypothetical protein
MIITKDMLIYYSNQVNSRRTRRELYHKMHKMMHGGSFDLLSEAIRREFKNPNTVYELEGRLVAINIFKKVIKKLAAVYVESPVRAPVDENSSDAELLEDYEDALKFNIRQKQANRYLEAYQKNLKEIFTGNDGKPYIKNHAPHTYEVFNIINPDKAQPDLVCKIIVDNVDPLSCVFHWFSDESFWVTDGTGTVIRDRMDLLNNKNGKNPARTLPFVYKCKSTDSVDPEIDDSLLRISIALPIVLTDLFFACKYQCWSMIYTIGVKGDIDRNPSSIVQLDFSDGAVDGGRQPVVGSINPNVDSDKVIGMIESTLAMFLSTMGLSAGTISLGKSARDVVSGVSKILDSAEVVEGKKDQHDDMIDDEDMTWRKLKQLIPYWRRNQRLGVELNREFSKTFSVSVSFKEPKPMLSEKDALELAEKKLKMRLTTYRRVLKEFHPDYTDDQIEDLLQEILDEMNELPELWNALNPVQVSIDSNLSNKQDDELEDEDDEEDEEETPKPKSKKAKKVKA